MSSNHEHEFAQLEVGEIFHHRGNKYRKTSERSAELFIDNDENGSEHRFFPDEIVVPEDDSTVED